MRRLITILSAVDDYCHEHDWVPAFIARPICDWFDWCLFRPHDR